MQYMQQSAPKAVEQVSPLIHSRRPTLAEAALGSTSDTSTAAGGSSWPKKYEDRRHEFEAYCRGRSAAAATAAATVTATGAGLRTATRPPTVTWKGTFELCFPGSQPVALDSAQIWAAQMILVGSSDTLPGGGDAAAEVVERPHVSFSVLKDGKIPFCVDPDKPPSKAAVKTFQGHIASYSYIIPEVGALTFNNAEDLSKMRSFARCFGWCDEVSRGIVVCGESTVQLRSGPRMGWILTTFIFTRFCPWAREVLARHLPLPQQRHFLEERAFLLLMQLEPRNARPQRLPPQQHLTQPQQLLQLLQPLQQLQPLQPQQALQPLQLQQPFQQLQLHQALQLHQLLQPLQPQQPLQLLRPFQPQQPIQLLQPLQPQQPHQLLQPFQPQQPHQLLQPFQPQQPHQLLQQLQLPQPQQQLTLVQPPPPPPPQQQQQQQQQPAVKNKGESDRPLATQAEAAAAMPASFAQSKLRSLLRTSDPVTEILLLHPMEVGPTPLDAEQEAPQLPLPVGPPPSRPAEEVPLYYAFPETDRPSQNGVPPRRASPQRRHQARRGGRSPERHGGRRGKSGRRSLRGRTEESPPPPPQFDAGRYRARVVYDDKADGGGSRSGSDGGGEDPSAVGSCRNFRQRCRDGQQRDVPVHDRGGGWVEGYQRSQRPLDCGGSGVGRHDAGGRKGRWLPDIESAKLQQLKEQVLSWVEEEEGNFRWCSNAPPRLRAELKELGLNVAKFVENFMSDEVLVVRTGTGLSHCLKRPRPEDLSKYEGDSDFSDGEGFDYYE